MNDIIHIFLAGDEVAIMEIGVEEECQVEEECEEEEENLSLNLLLLLTVYLLVPKKCQGKLTKDMNKIFT